MDLHGEVFEVAQKPALQTGRGQFLDVAFCLLVRFFVLKYWLRVTRLIRPLFLFLSPRLWLHLFM